MSETWLILDCPFLAYRAQYALGDFYHEDEPTSVVFGLLRDIVEWTETFQTGRIAFCFDARTNKRNDIYPKYKENRRDDPNESEEEKKRKVEFRRQVRRLREEDLFALGFRNVFWAEGYEADDVIASIVYHSLGEDDEAVIVATDQDLFQLISPRVSMFDPKSRKRKTFQWFGREYGISPSQWADVKALAGCDGDNVKGIKGIGEKLAIRYLTGSLTTGKSFEKIVQKNDIWRRNLKLVQLPFEGCPTFELREDRLSKKRWTAFCDRFGIKRLKGLYPGRGRE